MALSQPQRWGDDQRCGDLTEMPHGKGLAAQGLSRVVTDPSLHNARHIYVANIAKHM